MSIEDTHITDSTVIRVVTVLKTGFVSKGRIREITGIHQDSLRVVLKYLDDKKHLESLQTSGGVFYRYK